MAVKLRQWLNLVDEEYLRDFIVKGGAAVKFLISNGEGIAKSEAALNTLAAKHGLCCARIGGAETKLHMMQELFFAVSRQVSWERDAQCVVEALFKHNGYQWPRPGQSVSLNELADANQVDSTLLKREFNQWLTKELKNENRMSLDFRSAVTQLCDACLGTSEHGIDSVSPVLQWLRGELRLLGPLKSAAIFSKITRHSASSMLRSLCRWLVLAGHSGLYIAIDIRQLSLPTPSPDGMLRYSPAAVLDACEVLRQLVDGTDLYECLFVVVLANHLFIGGDPKRGVNAYPALNMRIWDDVRAQTQSNPLAPLIVIEQETE